MTTRLRPILLVEDNPRDLELTHAALKRCALANPIDVARDGADAIDYLYGRGGWAGRVAGDPAVVPAIQDLGVFRAVLNEPPPRLR